MAQINVYDAIYTKLTTDQGATSFYTAVGGRIYLSEAPQDATMPLAVYTAITDVPRGGFSTSPPDDVEMTFQVDLFHNADSNTPEDLIAINDKLLTLLHRQTFSATNHAGAQTWCTDKGVVEREEDAWRITSQWRFTATPTS